MIESHIEVWSPGAQAEAEQKHAEAIELLRQSSTFLLVYVNEQGVGMHVGLNGTVAQAVLLHRGSVNACNVLGENITGKLMPLLADIAEQRDDGGEAA